MSENLDGGQGDTGAGGGEITSFLDGIQSEDLRGNESLTGFENLDGLAQGYIDLKTSQPVLPENADGYQIDVPEGMTVDQADFGLFKEQALQMGLTNDQYQNVLKFDFARNARIAKNHQEAQDKAVAELKLELGDKYDESLATAQKVLRLSGQEGLAAMELGNNPELFRLLNWVGDKISEDQLETGVGGGSTDTRQKDDSGRPVIQYKNM